MGRWLLASLTFAVLSLASAPVDAAEVCDADERVCVAGAEWTSGEQLDDKTRAREAKRNRKGKDARLTVELTSSSGARGSVFLDGVWLSVAPVNAVALKPGKHDLEVRDGERVLARGVLVIGKKGGDVTVRVAA